MRHFAVGLTIILVLTLFTIEAKAGTGENVSGWAWSENVGWISLNNTSGGGSVSYGVSIDSSGIFSGYAWSENIGWISFNRADTGTPPASPYNGSETYIAKLDLATKEVSGWARVLANGGGWDGWIKLRGIAQDSSPYGVSVDTSVNPAEFRGWAWSDLVIGWISFNCSNQGTCGAISYKVVTTLSFNQSPSAINLSATPPDYCTSGATQNLGWTFSDPDPGDSQSAYQVQIDISTGDFSSPVDDTLKVISGSNAYTPVLGKLTYNQTYKWRVMVWDSEDVSSSWTNGSNFPTPVHRYPSPSFTYFPPKPSINEVVNFVDGSQCLPAIGEIFYSCNTNPSNRYQWDFEDDGTIDCDSNNNPLCRGNVSASYPKNRQYTIRLKVTDDVGTCSFTRQIIVTLPLPEWIEIPPFSWINRFLAALSAII